MSRAECHLVGILSFVGTPGVWTCATTLVRIVTFTQSTLHKVTEPVIFFQTTFSTCSPASRGNRSAGFCHIDICNFSVWLSVSSWLIIYKIRSSVVSECELNQVVYTCFLEDLDPRPAFLSQHSTTQSEVMTGQIVTVSVLWRMFYQSLSG